MKKIAIITSLFASISLNAQMTEQFPDPNHTYSRNNSGDRGFSQYIAPSLYQTNKVVLTFDDGPDAIKTPRLLNILKRYNVTATFFVVGKNITEKTSPVIERMLAEGHTVASHDWTHDNNNTETREAYKNGLKKSILKIKEEQQKAGIVLNEMYYRFPYGDYGRTSSYHHLNVMKEVSNELFGENCINFAFWDIDTADWVSNMKPQEISNTILAHLFGGRAYSFKKDVSGKYVKFPYEIQGKSILGGGVVLMHDIHDRTIDGVEIFLAEATKRGVQIIPLSEVDEFSYGNRRCELIK